MTKEKEIFQKILDNLKEGLIYRSSFEELPVGDTSPNTIDETWHRLIKDAIDKAKEEINNHSSQIQNQANVSRSNSVNSSEDKTANTEPEVISNRASASGSENKKEKSNEN